MPNTARKAPFSIPPSLPGNMVQSGPNSDLNLVLFSPPWSMCLTPPIPLLGSLRYFGKREAIWVRCPEWGTMLNFRSLGILALMLCATANAATITRVSVGYDGSEANGISHQAAVSGDGRYIVFASKAANLVAGDTNGYHDIFVFDRQTGKTQRVSVSSTGEQGDQHSLRPCINVDGRWIVFNSGADNFSGPDVNSLPGVFVHDRLAGTTERISNNNQGERGNGQNQTWRNCISDDGRFVVFESTSSNLGVDDADVNIRNVYIHDRSVGDVQLVSKSLIDNQYPLSDARSNSPSISGDGRFVSFFSLNEFVVQNDTNQYQDAFVYDRGTKTIERISVSSLGVQGDCASFPGNLSYDGRFATFRSGSTNFVPGDDRFGHDIFLRDRFAQTTTLISKTPPARYEWTADGGLISSDSEFIALDAKHIDGIRGYHYRQVYVVERRTDFIESVTVAIDGGLPDGSSYIDDISDDGSVVVFTSDATNLVPNDTNGLRDVFVWDRYGTLNTAPDITTIAAFPTTLATGETFSITASFTDQNITDTHTATIDWGDGTTSPAQITESNGAGTALADHVYTAAGIYTVSITLSDDKGATATASYGGDVVVYAPAGGFATGAASVDSPAGALPGNPAATGKANLILTAKYTAGAGAPTGSVNFNFPRANLRFRSDALVWMVRNGGTAIVRALGSLGGVPGYEILVSASDGQFGGASGVDLVRVKITEQASGSVIYDTQSGDPIVADPLLPVSGGNISVHE